MSLLLLLPLILADLTLPASLILVPMASLTLAVDNNSVIYCNVLIR